MPKAYTTKRGRRISAAIAILLALLTWSVRDRITWLPEGVEPSGDGQVIEARHQVQFGPVNSIAVLPFRCTASELPDGAGNDPVLAQGFAQSLIELLIGNPGLQVTAANSSFFFQDEKLNLALVGERLKAMHILHGCAVRTPQGIAVNARLINLRSNKQKWSGNYSGAVADIFSFQDQVAAGAANAVRAGLGAGVRGAPVIDSQAWLSFIEGQHLQRLGGPDNIHQAEAAFKAVLDTEPEYAPAMLGLTRVYLAPSMMAALGPDAIGQARSSANRALQYDPELAGAYLELSRISKAIDWNWRAALETARQALKFEPGSAEVLSNASSALSTFGQFEQAISLLNEAVKRNPLVLQNQQRLGLLFEYAGNYKDALLAYRVLLGLNPDYPGLHAYRARAMLAMSLPEQALEEASQEKIPFWRDYARILSLSALERTGEAEDLLQKMITSHGHDAAFQIAEIYAFSGDADQAFAWLDRAYQQRDGGMSELIGNYFLSRLHQDKRWQGLLLRMKLLPDS